tara:strand:- start:6218 stop:6400 length:183 start_codon:yes stop_codon:yes gene_type:complete
MELRDYDCSLELGPSIEILKDLSDKFKSSGDYKYVMQMMIIIDEMDIPVLLYTSNTEAEA